MAERAFREILAVDTNHADSLHMLGLIGFQSGHLDAAAELMQKAIKVNGRQAMYFGNLGLVLQALGRTEEAAAHYERALCLQPDFAEAHVNLGNLLHSQGAVETAIERYRRAIAIHPRYAEAHMNLGNALQSIGRLEEAVVQYERAVSLQPGYLLAHMNLGHLFAERGEPKKAIAHYERALAIRPNDAEALMNLGNVLQATSRWKEAITRYEQALAIHPAYAEAHMNLGTALDEVGKVDEAARHYEQALTIQPDYAEAHMNRALGQLKRGDFSAGWAGHEWRWRLDGNSSHKRQFSKPQWNGEPLQGQRILLHGEQGLGDCIQFLRHLPMVQASGGRVILEVPRGLLRLCSTLPGLACLLAAGEPLPDFDWHCPLMSLPLAFSTVCETIPAHVPYLSIPPEAQQMAARFPWPAKGLRVGLAWAGNPKHRNDQHRSIPFHLLAPLMHLANVELFSLQLGEAVGGLMTNLGPASTGLAETGALIQHLDLVVAVDTAVAHLTGALAKPVWILLGYQADWRWLRQRDDSPWYPTARLFRQVVPGDWKEVIDRVAAEISKIADPGNF